MEFTYEHKVQYYETDQMGIVHHSNYIRWFEEARTDLLDRIGCSYKSCEERGIISPVLSVECNYRNMSYFEDVVIITTKVTNFTGLKFSLAYTVTSKATGEVRATGSTSHCFLDRDGRPMRLAKTHPDVFDKMKSISEE